MQLEITAEGSVGVQRKLDYLLTRECFLRLCGWHFCSLSFFKTLRDVYTCSTYCALKHPVHSLAEVPTLADLSCEIL